MLLCEHSYAGWTIWLREGESEVLLECAACASYISDELLLVVLPKNVHGCRQG
jgi:hypothetical protein